MFGRMPQLSHFTTNKCIILGHQKTVLQCQPGLFHNSLSADAAICDDPIDFHEYPVEFSHSLTPSGMPSHQLRLKCGCDAMLHRNLIAEQGLCNGTSKEYTLTYNRSRGLNRV